MVIATARLVAISLLSCLSVVLCGDNSTGHHPWEWAATFDLPAGHYTWSFTKQDGVYADPTIQILVLPTSGTDNASLELVEGEAETKWAATPTDKSSYADLEVSTTYRLHMDEDTWTTHFILHVTAAGSHAVFLQHFPYEFENGFHFLQTEGGDDVEPVVEEPEYDGHGHDHGHGHDEEHPWEWAATFDLPQGHYTWSFTKKEGVYADPTIQILVLPTSGTDNASLELVEGEAETKWAMSPTVKSSYADLEVGTMYTLQMDEQTWTTHFILHVDDAGSHAVFLQHFPYEFENGFHFLQTEGGKDVEPVIEEPETESNHDGHDHGDSGDSHDGHDHGRSGDSHGGHDHGDSHDGHDHGGGDLEACPFGTEWEWAGIFAVSPGMHDWNAEKGADGAYPDATMRIAVFDTSEDSFSALHALALAAWGASDASEELEAGGTIPRGRAITLKFNQETWASHYKIDVPANGGGHIAVFAEHFPIEFEKNYHYLKDAAGADVEPESQCSMDGSLWEWAATFDLPKGHYTWSFTKQETGYADPTIRMLVWPTNGTDAASLQSFAEDAHDVWLMAPETKSSYAALQVGTTYTLQMDEQTWSTHFILHVDTSGPHAVFLQHFPYEFENGFHFLQTERGDNVEPVFENPAYDAHAGHDHGDSHAGHDHGDSHAGHDHGDSHAGHDHGDSHDGHDHGGSDLEACPGSAEGEWAGIFAVSPGWYDWNAEKGEDEIYPDATMKIAVFDTSETTFSALQIDVRTAWDAANANEELDAGGIIPLGRAITLKFNQETWASHYKIEVPASSSGHIAVFAQHFPIEFEKNYHYLKDATGADVEPKVECGVGGGHGGHDHGEPEEPECPWDVEWEWAGIFAVSPGKYDWNAEKGEDETYPDATMKIAVFDTSEASFKALHDIVHTAWSAGDADDELLAGGTIPRNRAITLKFNQATWASHFKIDVPEDGGGHIAVFAQHFPIEFEKNYHYLKDATGADIEPEFEQSVSDCPAETITTDDLWAEVIGAAFITGLPTLLGIFIIIFTLAPKISQMAQEGGGLLAVVHSFASGVIFAAAVFLLLPEGLYLATVGKTEAGGNGAWGTAILGGWFFCVMIKHLGQILGASSRNGGEDGKRIDWTVAVPIIFGDGFHNTADGLVIGTAFKTCTSSFGWKLTFVTVLHEIPQEISDFCILITLGRMHWGWATLANFLSGLTTVIGAIITYSIEVSPGVEGVILAAGGGVYLYVAMTELGPAVTELGKGESVNGAMMRVLGFSIGAILLGLILLDHEHCGGVHLLGYDPDAPTSGEAEADPHAGHNHR